jgi:hypothetical protein
VIRIVRGPEPRGLKRAAPSRLKAAAEAFNAHGGPSPQLTATLTGYGTRKTKEALFQAQRGKCAWCERHTDISSAPVEHYRPKDGAWRHLPGEPSRIDAGHYWWLTWSWSNLLFSCSRCNDAGHKANYFPLRLHTRSAAVPVSPLPIPPPSPVVDVSGEHPLLLDPAGSEDPLDHIEWRAANTTFSRRDWTWTPLGRTEEGDATVRILKLDELADRMQGHVRTRLLPSIEEMEAHLSAGRVAEAHKRWKQLLDDNLAPMSELTAFTWQALAFLVPENYRRRHGLAAPRKPGASRSP